MPMTTAIVRINGRAPLARRTGDRDTGNRKRAVTAQRWPPAYDPAQSATVNWASTQPLWKRRLEQPVDDDALTG